MNEINLTSLRRGNDEHSIPVPDGTVRGDLGVQGDRGENWTRGPTASDRALRRSRKTSPAYRPDLVISRDPDCPSLSRSRQPESSGDLHKSFPYNRLGETWHAPGGHPCLLRATHSRTRMLPGGGRESNVNRLLMNLLFWHAKTCVKTGDCAATPRLAAKFPTWKICHSKSTMRRPTA